MVRSASPPCAIVAPSHPAYPRGVVLPVTARVLCGSGVGDLNEFRVAAAQ
jgi:hypothetical protein